MTKLLEQALEVVRRMPPTEQDAVAQAMLSMADLADPEEIPAEDLPDVLEGLAQLERGEFASEEDIAAAFRRFER